MLANDVEQYGRRNNIRIRGLKLRHGEECQTAVAMFLNENLQVNINCEDIEAAHILPTRGALQCKTGRDRSRHLRL